MKSKPSPDLRARNHLVAWGLSAAFLHRSISSRFSSLAFLLLAYVFDPSQALRLIGPGLEALLVMLALSSCADKLTALSSLLWGSWLIVTGVLFLCVRGTLVITYPLIILMGGWPTRGA